MINSEVEILTSWDLAVQVAEALGPKRILPDVPKATVTDAAGVVRNGLEAHAFKGANIIYVTFRSDRADPCHDGSDEVVARYFVKHLEVHRSRRRLRFRYTQSDQVRSRLMQTEDSLRALTSKLGIISLPIAWPHSAAKWPAFRINFGPLRPKASNRKRA